MRVQFSAGNYKDSADFDVVPMQACSLLLGRPWIYDNDVLHHGRANTYSFSHKGKKIKLLPMTPAEILKDEVERAENERKCNDNKSENQVVAKNVFPLQHENKNTHARKDTIKLKGAAMLATKSEISDLLAHNSFCYALICKEALFTLEDMPPSLPPAVANLLQEYADVFPSEIPLGLPPLRGIEHQIDLIPGATMPN